MIRVVLFVWSLFFPALVTASLCVPRRSELINTTQTITRLFFVDRLDWDTTAPVLIINSHTTF